MTKKKYKPDLLDRTFMRLEGINTRLAHGVGLDTLHAEVVGSGSKSWTELACIFKVRVRQHGNSVSHEINRELLEFVCELIDKEAKEKGLEGRET